MPECRVGDVAQRLTGEEGLVAGDQDVGEGQQALEHVVLDDLRGEILEEQVGLLLVDVDGEIADLAALQALDHGAGVDQAASAGIDQHKPALGPGDAVGIDDVPGLRASAGNAA